MVQSNEAKFTLEKQEVWTKIEMVTHASKVSFPCSVLELGRP